MALTRTLVLAATVAVTAAGAGCSVPKLVLDGKQCPCTDGYVCDTTTNYCVASLDDGGLPDTPITQQCLPGAPGAPLYTYAGTFNWQSPDATWSGSAAGIVQTDTANMSTYAFTTSVSQAAYRVVSRMRQTASGNGSPRLGVVLRAQLTLNAKQQYDCLWEPKTAQLLVTATTSGNPTTLMSVGVPEVGANDTVTMEAQVVDVTGTPTISCCLRESAARLLDVADSSAMPVTSGQPGLATQRLAGEFQTFAVLPPPP